jgi:hypothetical protein
MRTLNLCAHIQWQGQLQCSHIYVCMVWHIYLWSNVLKWRRFSWHFKKEVYIIFIPCRSVIQHICTSITSAPCLYQVWFVLSNEVSKIIIGDPCCVQEANWSACKTNRGTILCWRNEVKAYRWGNNGDKQFRHLFTPLHIVIYSVSN